MAPKRNKLSFTGGRQNNAVNEMRSIEQDLLHYADFVLSTAEKLYGMEGSNKYNDPVVAQRKEDLQGEIFALRTVKNNLELAANGPFVIQSESMNLSSNLISVSNAANTIAESYRHVDHGGARKFVKENSSMLGRILERFTKLLHKAQSLFGLYDNVRKDILRGLDGVRESSQGLEERFTRG